MVAHRVAPPAAPQDDAGAVYALIVQCNEIAVDIDNEVQLVDLGRGHAAHLAGAARGPVRAGAEARGTLALPHPG